MPVVYPFNFIQIMVIREEKQGLNHVKLDSFASGSP